MRMDDFAYTVGIKVPFLPFYRKFRVTKHETEQLGHEVWMVLFLSSGAVQTIPNIASKRFRVYPDLQQSNMRRDQLREKFRREEEAAAVEAAERVRLARFQEQQQHLAQPQPQQQQQYAHGNLPIPSQLDPY